MENWIIYQINIYHPSTAAIELISSYLLEIGSVGIEINNAPDYIENYENLFGELPMDLPEEMQENPTEIIGYFEEDSQKETIEKWLEEQDLPSYELTTYQIQNENWQQNWMDFYQPEHVTRFVTIIPQWIDDFGDEDRCIIRLNPGVAFGTGNHPTTQLGVQALEWVMRGNERVIDVGCGTGILSFVAAAFGASCVLGLDLDPQAIASAESNMEYQDNPKILNLIEQNKLVFRENNLLTNISESADIIIANILPHILIDLFDDAVELLSNNGYLILGGILENKAPEIEARMDQYPFRKVHHSQTKEWVSLIYQKSNEI